MECQNIKTAILRFPDRDDFWICGIKWDGDGLKGEGKTIDEAVGNAVRAFYQKVSNGKAT